jgi:hypothetical protein
MPGTPTCHRLNADKRILTTDWSRYDGKETPRSIARRLAGSQVGVWWNLPRNVGYMLAGLWNSGPSSDPVGQH